jgi:hypothetical protein
VIAILERDPAKSGLYRSRQYVRQPKHTPEHHWIERRYLPLRQQVALVHEATAGLFREAFAGKEATWLDEPATEKQLEALRSHRLRPAAPRVVPRSRQMERNGQATSDRRANRSRIMTLKKKELTLQPQ